MKIPAKSPHNTMSKGRTSARRPLEFIPLQDSQLLPLLHKYHGNISAVARAIGAERCAVDDAVRASPLLSAARTHARERIVDDLEDVAVSIALEDRNVSMVQFLLKTRGRQRGYGAIEQDAASTALTQAFAFVRHCTGGGAIPVEPLD